MQGKTIFHLDLDSFFVAVERIRDPSLRGKPVVVGGSLDSRGVVSAASYEARSSGVHSAMPIAKAKQLCPHAVFVTGYFSDYGYYSEKFFRVLHDYSPVIEKTSIDEGYMDVTGGERLWGHPLKLAEEIKLRIKNELGLPVSIGISSNKLLAKMASEFAKPDGIFFVLPDREQAFISPMPVESMPSVGPSTVQKLKSKNIKVIEDLYRMGSDKLERLLGVHGSYIYKASSGEGRYEVQPGYVKPKSISREHTFSRDTKNISFIEATLLRLTERAVEDMRSKHLKVRTISLKLRYSDFETIVRSQSLSVSNDLESVIFSKVRRILHASYQKQMAVRLVGMGLSNLEEESQLSLFCDEREVRLKQLYNSVDRVRERFGSNSVVHARGKLGDDYRKKRLK